MYVGEAEKRVLRLRSATTDRLLATEGAPQGTKSPHLRIFRYQRTMGAPYLSAHFAPDVGIHSSTVGSLRHIEFLNDPNQGLRLPHLAKNERDTRISCTRLYP